MPNEETREMRNYANYITRKIKEETAELEVYLQDRYKTLEAYKTCRFEESHNDDELAYLVETELGEEPQYFDEQNGTQEEQDQYEALYNGYYEELHSTLNEIDTFQEANESCYLKEDKDYAEFIEQGAELETLVEQLKAFTDKLIQTRRHKMKDYYEADMQCLELVHLSKDVYEDIRQACNAMDRYSAEKDFNRPTLTRMYYHLYKFILAFRASEGMCGHQLFNHFLKKLKIYEECGEFDSQRNKGMTDPEVVAVNMILAYIATSFIESHD